jgi:6-pyruvoyltetrahydropterin/6-carboxytetrahydropterin synthase
MPTPGKSYLAQFTFFGKRISMRVELTKEFKFEAAHFLPKVPDDHKCKRMHGHSYRIQVSITGPMDQGMGWVIDLGDLADAFVPLLEKLDHRCLNDVEGLENPTSENLCIWVMERLKVPGAAVSKVVVLETCTSSATVYAS